MRIVAIDEGSFPKDKTQTRTILLGCVLENHRIATLAITNVTIDGVDGTERVFELLSHHRNADLVLLASVSVAGFNTIDPYVINEALRLPVIVVNPERPRLARVRDALQKYFDDWPSRLDVFYRTGHFRRVVLRGGGVLYYHAVGMRTSTAAQILRELTVFGKRPEPLRVARIIARALSQWSFLQAGRGVGKEWCHKTVI